MISAAPFIDTDFPANAESLGEGYDAEEEWSRLYGSLYGEKRPLQLACAQRAVRALQNVKQGEVRLVTNSLSSLKLLSIVACT